MENNIIFDSLEHIRKIKIKFSVVAPTGAVLSEHTVLANRLNVWKTDHYNRIDISFTDETDANVFRDVADKFYEAKQENGYNSYITVVAHPKGLEHDDRVIFFISTSNLAYFDSSETQNENIIFTTQADAEFYAIVNGEKIRDGIYSELSKSVEQITTEETELINGIMNQQDQADWFPSIKDFVETKKKLDKEKKGNKGIMNTLFGPSKSNKSQNNQQGVKTEDGSFINPKSLKTHQGSAHPEQELNNIIGLENIKTDIAKMQSMLEYEQSRRSRGIETHGDVSMHMCYMGHPGTGKTTIARIMTGILYNMKCIKKNQCIEVSGLDLKGGYVGQTAIITKAIVDMARGGILFIDEAYALCEDKGNSFGKEAISVLLKEMEDNRGDLIVILAGYEDDMNQFLNVNPGFRSRINKYFDFEDYSVIELTKIFVNYIKKMHLKIEKGALTKCVKLFKEAKKHPNFSNGRFVRNLTEQIEETHILNSVEMLDNLNRMDLITDEDVPDKLIEKMLYGM